MSGDPRRRLTAGVLDAMGVANDLIRGGKPLCAIGLRAGLTAQGLRTTDRGNQHLGDSYLGRWGLPLESSKQMVEGRMTVVYRGPLRGITRADLERSFAVPPGFDWSAYAEFESPHVVPDPAIRLSRRKDIALRTCPPYPICQQDHAGPGSPGDTIEASSDAGASVQPGDSVEVSADAGVGLLQEVIPLPRSRVPGVSPGAEASRRGPRPL